MHPVLYFAAGNFSLPSHDDDDADADDFRIPPRELINPDREINDPGLNVQLGQLLESGDCDAERFHRIRDNRDFDPYIYLSNEEYNDFFKIKEVSFAAKFWGVLYRLLHSGLVLDAVYGLDIFARFLESLLKPEPAEVEVEKGPVFLDDRQMIWKLKTEAELPHQNIGSVLTPWFPPGFRIVSALAHIPALVYLWRRFKNRLRIAVKWIPRPLFRLFIFWVLTPKKIYWILETLRRKILTKRMNLKIDKFFQKWSFRLRHLDACVSSLIVAFINIQYFCWLKAENMNEFKVVGKDRWRYSKKIAYKRYRQLRIYFIREVWRT